MLYWPVPTSVESSTVRGRSDSGAAGPFVRGRLSSAPIADVTGGVTAGRGHGSCQGVPRPIHSVGTGTLRLLQKM